MYKRQDSDVPFTLRSDTEYTIDFTVQSRVSNILLFVKPTFSALKPVVGGCTQDCLPDGFVDTMCSITLEPNSQENVCFASESDSMCIWRRRNTLNQCQSDSSMLDREELCESRFEMITHLGSLVQVVTTGTQCIEELSCY